MAQTLKFGNKVWAAKEDSVLAYNDINNNYKPLPFSFSRASIGTRVNKDGLIETMGQDIARIDYTDSADGVLLLEPSRTNLVTYSEDFSNGSWIKTNATIQLNSSISPDGTLNAVNLIPSTSSGVHNIKNTPTLTNNYCSGSWFVKANGYSKVSLREDGVFGRYISCDLSKGTILEENATTSAEIKDFGNGWYRIKFTDVVVSSGTKISLYVLPDSYTSGAPNVLNWSGNGSDGVLIYGAMLEDASYVSSYIPTSGSTVTRAAETCNNSGNSEVFNDSEGVLFLNLSVLANDLSNRWISISQNSVYTNNQINFRYASGSNLVQVVSRAGGLGQDVVMSNTLNDVTMPTKVAIKYELNNWKLLVNGFIVNTATSSNAFTPNSLDVLDLDRGNNTNNFYGKTKEIGYYDTALTDAELETLTSYRSWVSMVNELNLNIIYNG